MLNMDGRYQKEGGREADTKGKEVRVSMGKVVGEAVIKKRECIYRFHH